MIMKDSRRNLYRTVRAFFVIFCALGLFACSAFCNHEWKESTCTEPKICTKCGETEGNIIAHEWKAATCTDSKTCRRCGVTEGEPLGHDWKDASYTAAKRCEECGQTEGEPLDILEKYPADQVRYTDGRFTITPEDFTLLVNKAFDNVWTMVLDFETDETCLYGIMQGNHVFKTQVMTEKEETSGEIQSVYVELDSKYSNDDDELTMFLYTTIAATQAVDGTLSFEEAKSVTADSQINTTKMSDGTERAVQMNRVNGIQYSMIADVYAGNTTFRFLISPPEEGYQNNGDRGLSEKSISQKNVIQACEDSYTSAKNHRADRDYEYLQILKKAQKEQKAINDGLIDYALAEELFGSELSDEEITKRTRDLLSYLAEEDMLSALMRKFQKLSSVTGEIDRTKVDIEVANTDDLLEELGIRPEVMGKILAMLDIYDASWLMGDEGKKNLQFTDTGFTFSWTAVGAYSLSL